MRDLTKTLTQFELIAQLCEKSVTEHDGQDVEQGGRFFVESVEEVISQLPQMTLPPGGEVSSLLDRYYLFQAVVSKALHGMYSLLEKNPTDRAWELFIKVLTKLTILFGALYENYGGPFFMMMGDMASSLQQRKSEKEMDVYAGCVEAIKALIDHANQKKKDAHAYVQPLLNKLEFFMKERFRHDRTINAALLMQPFAEIGQFLSQEGYGSLSGREEIMSDLKRVLSQFAVLETISERLGESGQTDTSSSYHEDLPFMKGSKEKGERE